MVRVLGPVLKPAAASAAMAGVGILVAAFGSFAGLTAAGIE